jgi:Ca2+-binding EF-hand superfamily protein
VSVKVMRQSFDVRYMGLMWPKEKGEIAACVAMSRQDGPRFFKLSATEPQCCPVSIRSTPKMAGHEETQKWRDHMTVRAHLHMVTLAGLIAVGGAAADAKGSGAAERFEEIDTNGDGELTQTELKAHGEARFAAADTDGDGLLSDVEMAAARAERGGKRAARMLERFDADQNGALDADELAKAAEARGGKRGNRMLKRLDANVDGKLSFEEMSGRRDASKMFERLDADNSGTLSAEEFAKAAERGKRRHRTSDND